jgi:hypothetical protein
MQCFLQWRTGFGPESPIELRVHGTSLYSSMSQATKTLFAASPAPAFYVIYHQLKPQLKPHLSLSLTVELSEHLLNAEPHLISMNSATGQASYIDHNSHKSTAEARKVYRCIGMHRHAPRYEIERLSGRDLATLASKSMLRHQFAFCLLAC